VHHSHSSTHFAFVANLASKDTDHPLATIRIAHFSKLRRKVDQSRNVPSVGSCDSRRNFIPSAPVITALRKLRQCNLWPLRLGLRVRVSYYICSLFLTFILAKRFIPIVPALPNGLRDVLGRSRSSQSYPVDSRQKGEHLNSSTKINRLMTS
jgi:hypothetical protein